MEIIPSILTTDPTEVVERLASVHGLDLTVQLDFVDGQFAPAHSLAPDELPDELRTVPWEAHLMVREPVVWSQALYPHGCRRLYWHVEVLPPETAIPHYLSRVEHGVALRLETPVEAVEPFLPMAQSVLLLSISEPGFQGKLFQEAVYGKVQALKQRHPHLKLTVDGGVSLEHLRSLSKLGVDRVAVGAAFWKFGDPKTVLAAFRQATLLP